MFSLLALLKVIFSSRAEILVENLALRHQIGVLGLQVGSIRYRALPRPGWSFW